MPHTVIEVSTCRRAITTGGEQASVSLIRPLPGSEWFPTPEAFRLVNHNGSVRRKKVTSGATWLDTPMVIRGDHERVRVLTEECIDRLVELLEIIDGEYKQIREGL